MSIFLFLLCPLLSFIWLLPKLKDKTNRILFLLFSFYFGYTLYVPAVKGLEQISVDSTYHRQFFEYRSLNETFPEYINRFFRYISFDVDYQTGDLIKDYYLETVSFIASRFSSDYHLLFALCSLVIGYLTLRCLKILTENFNIKWSYLFFCIFLLFTYNQLIKVHSMRFPTAAWFSVLCMLELFVNKNKKYLYILPFVVVIHGSFAFFLIIFFIAYFTKKWTNVWMSLFLVSIFVSSLPPEWLESLSNLLPERLQIYFNYGTEEVMAERADLVSQRRTGTLITLFGMVQNIFFNILTLFLIKYYSNPGANKNSLPTFDLYQIALPLLTIINMFAFVKEFSERYRMISYPIIAILCMYSMRNDRTIRSLVGIIPVILIYQMALYGYLYYMTSGMRLLIPPLIEIPYMIFTGELLG